jgi:peptide/nickel transport system substrate-binding protein
MRYLTIQTTVPPFDNVHCRRAVQYAVNKVDLQAARGGPITGGDIADNTFPPTLAGAPQNVQARYPNGADHKGNIAEAKRELAECGHPDGFAVTMAGSVSPKSKAIGAATQQALAKVGIKVDIKSFDASQYYSSVIGSPSNVAKNKIGLADAGWGPDFPTGYGFYYAIVDGRAIKAQGNSNYSELNDPVINKLIDDSLVATDRAAFDKAYQDVDKQLMEDASMVPFVFDRSLTVQSERLKNVYFNQGYGHFDLATMGVQ